MRASAKAARTSTKATRQTAARTPRPNRARFVVGIGASAGGLAALTSFFENMPADSGMAFLVVTHQGSNHPSMLPTLLARSTRMQVESVRDAALLERDHVYVSVPGKHVALVEDALRLVEPGLGPSEHLPIDYFFRSLAQDQGDRAICIVLSGTGTDGTLGLRAIKGNSGMAMVQDESSARFTGMPHSAAGTQLSDYVLSPEQMPATLLAYGRNGRQAASEADASDSVAASGLEKLFALLRNRVGHDFTGYKSNTIERRVARRMRIHQVSSVASYVRLLQAQPHELDLLFQELLIPVTQFFRDPEAFASLADVLRDRIAGRQDQLSIRVWVPGCSTGEEAYSIAILVHELAERAGKNVQLQLFATDINPQVIEIARMGSYPQGIAADVGMERLARFFVAEKTGYRICKPIRDCIVFANQDILRDPPFTRLDLLSCRNLLIYLSSDRQQRVMPMFHFALKPGGVLWLGTSETASGYADLFAVTDRKWKVYERRKMVLGAVPKLDVHPERRPQREQSTREAAPAFTGLRNVLDGVLLDRFAPASLVFTDQGDIAFSHGHLRTFLQPTRGDARQNVFTMVRQGLQMHLRAAVRTASRSDDEVKHERIPLRANGRLELVTLIVQRITQPESLRGLFRASFTSMAGSKSKKASAAKGPRPKRAVPIAKELKRTRDSLLRTMDELQTSNEELKSSIEELQSTNEELQSMNEELETSKEELQSVNEELQTLNLELQTKNDELAQVNDDMQNLLNGTEIATLFLDRELRIKRFTAQARRVVRLIASDVGRPVADLAPQVTYAGLSSDAREVLRTLQPHEAETQTLDGRWLLVRVLPYRTAEDRIDGVVITFVDIDRIKRAELLAAAREFAASVVHTVPVPLLVLDANLHVVSANRACSRLFGVELTEIEGRSLFDIGERVFALPDLRTLLLGVVTEGEVINAYEFAPKEERGEPKRLSLNARRLEQGGVGSGHVLVALQTVSAAACVTTLATSD